MSPRRSLGIVLLVTVPVATACGIGKGNETDRERTTPYVANASVGSMLVRDVSLLPAAGASAATAQAYLVAAFVNHASQPDTLVGATVDNVSVTPTGDTTIPSNRLVRFGDPENGDTGGTLPVSGLPSTPTVGRSVSVTFRFANAGQLTMLVPIRDPAAIGTTLTSTPLPITGTYPAPATEVPASSSPLPSNTP